MQFLYLADNSLFKFRSRTQPTLMYLRVRDGLASLIHANSQGVQHKNRIELSSELFESLLSQASDVVSLNQGRTYEVYIEFVDEYQRVHTKHRLWNFDCTPLRARLFGVLSIIPDFVKITQITITEND